MRILAKFEETNTRLKTKKKGKFFCNDGNYAGIDGIVAFK